MKNITFVHIRLATLLDDKLIQAEFLSCSLKHTFLHTALSDEAENINLFRLADTMG
jgi:hypothetical protein